MAENNLAQASPKSASKFILLMTGLGMITTLSLVSIYMPRTILWYFDPPMPNGISCTSSIRWAVDRLLTAQLVSLGVGAVIGLLIGFKFAKKKSQSIPL
ncbi:MAG: hypothetical protein H7333_09815 [Bdellovibrionales bacterium]|nr:hypothetical protein [Oligoflexia bacterium]